jgi:hypothetical protein
LSCCRCRFIIVIKNLRHPTWRAGLWKVVHRYGEKVGRMAVLLRSFRIFLEFPAFSGFFQLVSGGFVG